MAIKVDEYLLKDLEAQLAACQVRSLPTRNASACEWVDLESSERFAVLKLRGVNHSRAKLAVCLHDLGTARNTSVVVIGQHVAVADSLAMCPAD